MLLHEFRHALRRLLKNPWRALLSAGVLGVGLGVVLFLFTLVDSVILTPYPFPQPQQLVVVGQSYEHGIGAIDSDQYMQLEGHFKSAQTMGAWNFSNVNLDQGQGAVRYLGAVVTPSLLPMLGARPLLGRSLQAGDGTVGAPSVVVLSETVWRRAFHADPTAIGRSVRVNGEFATVVGVLRDDFKYPPRARLWLPLHLSAGQHRSLVAVMRLTAGVTLAQARAELRARAPALQRLLPASTPTRVLAAGPLMDSLTPTDLRRWVWLMFGACVLVLMLACVNIANLQLVATLKRQHELALRSALGCGRVRLFVGALCESLVLSLLALLPALAIAHGGVRWLRSTWLAVHPQTMPYLHGLDAGVIAFAVLVALLSTVLAGGIPAWRASRAGMGTSLRDGGKGSARGFARVSKTLVVIEVALTVVLLVGAGSFVRALDHVLEQPSASAAQTEQIQIAQVSLPHVDQHDAEGRIRFLDAVVARLRHDPSVVSAGAASQVPEAMLGQRMAVARPGHPRPAAGWPQARLGVVDAGYAALFPVSLQSGRLLDARDRAGSAPVAVIDARLAATLWPHANALGQQLLLDPDGTGARTLTVVGVIAPLQRNDMLGEVLPGLLVPLDQAAGLPALLGVALIARVHPGFRADTGWFDDLVHAVDAQAAIYAVHSQAWFIHVNRLGVSLLTQAFSLLGLIALLLAAAGLYGVLSFSVAQRTREIGIRRAVGAPGSAVAQTVGRTLAWQLGVGVLAGVALALPWSAMLADPALGIRAYDPVVFVQVLLVTIGVSMLAALIPLWRALRIDPAEALRHE